MNHSNPHRLWYEALQRSDTRKWSKKCRDLLLDAHELDWEDWWEEVGEYFEPLAREDMETVVLLPTKKATDDWWESFAGDEDYKLVYVNLQEPDSRLLEDFAKLIKSYRQNKAGRPRFEGKAPDFPFARIPNVKVINDMLTCYDLKKAAKEADVKKSLYKIGVEADVSPGYVVDVKDNKGEIDRKRRLMTITVARIIQRAEDLIAGVERGSFPSY